VKQTFIGSEWALFPPHNNWGGLNIVGSYPDDGNTFDQARAISHVVARRILVVLLMRPGESIFHVRLGIAPDLFDSLNSQTCSYFVYHCKEEIERWNRWGFIGISALQVSIDPQTVYTNCITVNITFTAIGSGENSVLSFGYFQPSVYHNRVQSVAELIRNISLDGEAFELRSLPSEFNTTPVPLSFSTNL
jgi:hypothetical protein